MRPNESFARLFFGVSAALAFTFCGGQAVDSGSSESHFLSPCEASCATGLSCICGICTKPCETAADCTSLSGRATCTASTGCDSSQPSICDAVCQSAADCSALGAGYDCVNGRCREALIRDADAGTLSCGEREQLASEHVANALASADLTCAVDADCETISIDSLCHAACGALVSTNGAKDVQSTIDALNAGLCATFAEDGCVLIIPPCVVVLGQPVCLNGKCADSAALTCDERAASAEQRIVEAAQSADLSCATNADCSYVANMSNCSFSCEQLLVSANGAGTVQAAIDEVNATICAGFEQACPPQISPCPSGPGQPACVDGICVAACFPGELRSCPCSDSGVGVQTCSTDSSWGGCVCTEPL